MLTLYTSQDCEPCIGFDVQMQALADEFGLPLTIRWIPKADFPTMVIKSGYTFGVPQVEYQGEVYAGLDLVDRLRPVLEAARSHA